MSTQESFSAVQGADLEHALKRGKRDRAEKKDFVPGFCSVWAMSIFRMGKWTSAGRVWGRSFVRFRSVVFMLRLEDLYLGREDPGDTTPDLSEGMRTTQKTG